MRLDQEPSQESALRQKLRTFLAFLREVGQEVIRIVWRLPSEPFEFILAIEIISFGVVLLSSDSFSRAPAFAAMAAIASQNVWSTVAATIGTLHLWGLLLRRPRFRQLALLGMWMFWLLVAIQLWLANQYVSTGVTTYGILAIAAAIAHLRLQREP